MNYASATLVTADSTEQSQRSYLQSRLYCVLDDLKMGLRKKFGLLGDDTPATPAEFVQRIKDGKFVIQAGKADYESYDASRYITWRDPAVVEDKAGYKAARALLYVAHQKVADTIAIASPADGLVALNAFQAWTLPVTPTA